MCAIALMAGGPEIAAVVNAYLELVGYKGGKSIEELPKIKSGKIICVSSKLRPWEPFKEEE